MFPQVWASAPATDFAKASEIKRDVTGVPLPDTDEGNTLMLNPRSVEGWRLQVHEEHTKQPFGRKTVRWDEQETEIADDGNVLMLRHSYDDLAKDKKSTRVNVPVSVFGWTGANKEAKVLQPDEHSRGKKVLRPRVISQIENALLAEHPDDEAFQLIRRQPHDPRVVDVKRRDRVWQRLNSKLRNAHEDAHIHDHVHHPRAWTEQEGDQMPGRPMQKPLPPVIKESANNNANAKIADALDVVAPLKRAPPPLLADVKGGLGRRDRALLHQVITEAKQGLAPVASTTNRNRINTSNINRMVDRTDTASVADPRDRGQRDSQHPSLVVDVGSGRGGTAEARPLQEAAKPLRRAAEHGRTTGEAQGSHLRTAQPHVHHHDGGNVQYFLFEKTGQPEVDRRPRAGMDLAPGGQEVDGRPRAGMDLARRYQQVLQAHAEQPHDEAKARKERMDKLYGFQG
eukprot:gene32243-16808_t